jgi:hypothetical protein
MWNWSAAGGCRATAPCRGLPWTGCARTRGCGSGGGAAYDPAKVPGLVRNTREAYERLAELCRSQGIALGVVMIPSRRAENWPEDRLLDALTADLATLDIPSLRLAPEDFTDMDFFPGDGHWNERGHRKAAARVVPFVVGLAGD